MASQAAFPTGHDHVIVQAGGDGINIQVGLAYLLLTPLKARLRGAPHRVIEILDPAFEAVPLAGREADLQYLLDWLGEETKIAITCLIGPGGSGKTRLAFELLKRLPDGWQGGFLTREEATRFAEAKGVSSWSWQKPTLIVVDYAALLTEKLAHWFSALVDHSPHADPLRILLLERHADLESGWYFDLADGAWSGRRVHKLFWPAKPRRLARLNQPEQRRSVLAAGIHAAQALSQKTKAGASLPEPGEDLWFDQHLADSQWADPLLLLMASLIAASDGIHAALALSRPDLAKGMAVRERERLRSTVEDQNAKDLLAHLYGCITLCGGLSRDSMAAIASREFAALGQHYPGGADQGVDDLARFLGARASLPPLTPDLLGEALLLVTFDRIGASVTARLASVAPARVAATLIRCVQDFAHWGYSAPLEWLQTLVAHGKQDLSILVAIEEVLPRDTVALRMLAVDVSQMLVGRFVQSPLSIWGPAQAYLARLWTNLSVRQGEVGRLEEAVGSAVEAVRICRSLAETNPDGSLSSLALSLNNLAGAQGAMGRPAEALASVAEAVRHYRAITELKPNAALPALALSLNTLANTQRALGQRAEALTSIEEAVRIYRPFAEADPDAFLAELARSLNNLSLYRGEMGQHAKGLSSSEEAVLHYRKLVQVNPDEIRPALAESLTILANQQSEMGQRAEALASIAEGVRILRALVEPNPDAFRPGLARSLNNLATRQSDMGQRAEALASVVEAVRIHRTLAEANPDAFRPDLAVSLNNLAATQGAMGRRSEAILSILEAVSTNRALAKVNPSAFLPKLAMSLDNQANMQMAMGQLTEATVSNLEAVRIRRELAGNNPDAFIPGLALSLTNLAIRHSAMRERAEALASVTEAVGYYRGLVKANPAAFIPELARSLCVLSNALSEVGKLPESRDAATESLRYLAPLCLQYPGAFSEFAKFALRCYLLRIKQLGTEPDREIVSQFNHLFSPGGSKG